LFMSNSIFKLSNTFLDLSLGYEKVTF
jgi:hypothetical protein